MADAMIGNVLNVAARSNVVPLATVTVGTAANTVTVDTPGSVQVGSLIDFVTKTTGVVVATNRQVTSITSAGVLIFSGAVATIATTEGVYLTGQFTAIGNSPYSNLNGGTGVQVGLVFQTQYTIASMRARLAVISAGYYTAARLNEMSVNDMKYAIRLADNPGSMN